MPGADLFDKLVSNLNKDGTTSIVKTSTNPPNNKKDAPPPKQSKVMKRQNLRINVELGLSYPARTLVSI
jgi:hypothetical protein